MSINDTCELCEGPDEPCRAAIKAPNGTTCKCTRSVGHDGDHAACGIREDEHPIYRWPQDGCCPWCGAGPSDLHPAACPTRSRGEVGRWRGPCGDWCVQLDDGSFTIGRARGGYDGFVGRRYYSLPSFGQSLAEIGLGPAHIDPRSALGQMLVEAGWLEGE